LESAPLGNVAWVVLDVSMPGMSGIDLLRRVATTCPRISVIILTAHADDETRRRSIEAGAMAFLGKPVRSAALVDDVREALTP
jgi:FixJ family two-component response regulator